MSPLLVKILIAIIGKLGGEMLLIALKELAKEYQAHRAFLTPEQRTEWDRNWTEEFYVGEAGGTGPGIILENAIDPAAHKDDEVKE